MHYDHFQSDRLLTLPTKWIRKKNQDHWVKTGTVQYLLNVCDKISRKIPAVVVKDAKHPAFLQTIFMYDFDHVAFLEVKKCGLLGHMIVQSPYIFHLLKRNQQHGRLRSTSIQWRRNMKTQQSPMILDSCLRKTGGGIKWLRWCHRLRKTPFSKRFLSKLR